MQISGLDHCRQREEKTPPCPTQNQIEVTKKLGMQTFWTTWELQ